MNGRRSNTRRRGWSFRNSGVSKAPVKGRLGRNRSDRGVWMKRFGTVALAVSAFLLAAVPAQAIDVLRKDVAVGSSVQRTCAAKKLSGGAGYAQQTVTMPV